MNNQIIPSGCREDEDCMFVVATFDIDRKVMTSYQANFEHYPSTLVKHLFNLKRCSLKQILTLFYNAQVIDNRDSTIYSFIQKSFAPNHPISFGTLDPQTGSFNIFNTFSNETNGWGCNSQAVINPAVGDIYACTSVKQIHGLPQIALCVCSHFPLPPQNLFVEIVIGPQWGRIPHSLVTISIKTGEVKHSVPFSHWEVSGLFML